MEKDLMNRIVINPKILVGKPVVRGTRVAVYEIVNRIAQGQSFEEVAEDLEIGKEDIKAALAYAGNLAEGEDVFPVISDS